MIEHMLKIIDTKEGRHGLAYGYFLSRVFKHFGVAVGRGTVDTRKQMFTLSMLEKCECVAKRSGVGVQSTIFGLIEAQRRGS